MSYNARNLCLLCAWRGTCAKRFCLAEGTLNCPDFSEDVLLQRERERAAGVQNPPEKKNAHEG